jgi:uncharacterized DUF497 family protein
MDFDLIQGFEWDDGNARKSADRHGVSQSEAEEVFFNAPLLASGDARHSEAEQRFHALGKTDTGRALHLTFALCANGTRIRVISTPDMSRKERSRYEQET